MLLGIVLQVVTAVTICVEDVQVFLELNDILRICLKEIFAMRCSNSQKIKLEIYMMSFPIGQNLRFK